MIFLKVSVALVFCVASKLYQNISSFSPFLYKIIQCNLKDVYIFLSGFFFFYLCNCKRFQEIHDELWNWQFLFTAFSEAFVQSDVQMPRITVQLCPGFNWNLTCSLLRYIQVQNLRPNFITVQQDIFMLRISLSCIHGANSFWNSPSLRKYYLA